MLFIAIIIVNIQIGFGKSFVEKNFDCSQNTNNKCKTHTNMHTNNFNANKIVVWFN